MSVTFWDRLLAKLDFLFHSFQIEGNLLAGGIVYFHHAGNRMHIKRKDGSVRLTCGAGEIRHEYNFKGQLMSRTVMRKTVLKNEGESISYSPAINQARGWSASNGR